MAKGAPHRDDEEVEDKDTEISDEALELLDEEEELNDELGITKEESDDDKGWE